jgi:FG-GAP-like repeat/RTX calcium-binding nonapeptide repeat (4 copies)
MNAPGTVFAADLRPPRARLALAIGTAAVAALWLLASPPALAQLNFSSTDYQPFGGSETPEQVVTSDFNNDSHLDLAIAENGSYLPYDVGGVQMMLGDGDGGFSEFNEYFANDGPVSLAAADFNADQHPDLAVANNSSGDVSVLLGTGNGSFGQPTNITTGPGPTSIVAAFFNADRHPDLAVANAVDDNVAILLGNGDGSFTGSASFDAGDGPAAVAAGEFNSDGNLDLVVADAGGLSGVASILLGRGDGSFGGAAGMEVGPVPGSVAVGDFDGDTNADLAFGAPLWAGGGVAVVLGRGDGSFGEPAQYSVGKSASSVATADFNADSVPDLATTDPSADPNSTAGLSVLLGQGDGDFGPPTGRDTFHAESARSVTVGNFNTDPLPDMATTGYAGDTDEVTVLLNTTPRLGRARTVSVAPGGSCLRGGGRGTVELALARSGRRARGLALSVTSSNHRLVPTRRMVRRGKGARRTLTLRPVAGRRGSAVVTVNRLRRGQLTGSVRIRVRVGGRRGDRLVGGRSADVVLGKQGSDRLAGRGGNDLLCGAKGADLMRGGRGADHLRGGPGPDNLDGGRGPDRLAPGAGNDRVISRGGGRDRVLCGNGHDTVIADQRDRLHGCERALR